ncbi:MAG TPA: hypothetical protein VGP63_26805 [Planctomycetaceae bacterium]|jgi:hypothetical protein|nr:hypothetical protein [Planctomycetaceae bacterium]
MRNSIRNSICSAMLLVASAVFVTPALAAGDKPADSPKPSPATYQVTGLKWNGYQYMQQPAYSLSTPNLKQAVDYAGQFCRFPGWAVTTNLPPAFGIPTVADSAVSGAQGTVLGARQNADLPPWLLNMLYAWGIQPSQLQPSIGGAQSGTGSSDPTFGVGDVSVSSDTSGIQNMIATQDMINNQQMLNNIQDMVNTQNMINTQNMVNSMQDMVNAQNAVNEQNMINAMSNP